MQATCWQCGQLLAVDDSKAPPQAFSVKCPKCSAAVKFGGRDAAMSAASMAPMPPSTGSTRTAPPQPRPDRPPLAGRVLVAVPQVALATAVARAMVGLGFTVDTSDDCESGARLIDQGAYDYAVTVRAVAAPGKEETLYQRIMRMPPDVRRGFFVILAGDDEFKTGDGPQAFASMADFVLNGADIAAMEPMLRAAIDERTRLYQPLRDARKRIEAAG